MALHSTSVLFCNACYICSEQNVLRYKSHTTPMPLNFALKKKPLLNNGRSFRGSKSFFNDILFVHSKAFSMFKKWNFCFFWSLAASYDQKDFIWITDGSLVARVLHSKLENKIWKQILLRMKWIKCIYTKHTHWLITTLQTFTARVQVLPLLFFLANFWLYFWYNSWLQKIQSKGLQCTWWKKQICDQKAAQTIVKSRTKLLCSFRTF